MPESREFCELGAVRPCLPCMRKEGIDLRQGIGVRVKGVTGSDAIVAQ